jgi:hypothetical protein
MNRVSLLFPGGRSKAFTLSYDDGAVEDRRLLELCRTYGVKGTFNLNSGRLGMGRNLKADEIRDLYTSDVAEIATHGSTHAYLNQLPVHAAFREILDDRNELEHLAGSLVRGHAYPYGAYNETVIGVLKAAGIMYARTVKSSHDFKLPENWHEWNPTCHHDDPMLSELTDKFFDNTKPTEPSLFYVWGHSYEFGQKNNWEVIERLMEQLSCKTEVWFAANIEIYDYSEAYSRLIWSADCGQVFNPSMYDVWFNTVSGIGKAPKTYVVKAGEKIKL